MAGNNATFGGAAHEKRERNDGAATQAAKEVILAGEMVMS
jgi:hypothetical protein